MFQLRVTSYDNAVRLLTAEWPTRVVSILVGDVHMAANHLHVRIDDIIRPSSGLILPMAVHLQQVLTFTEDIISDDRLLIYCKSGVNRSTAMAIAVLIQHGANYTEAWKIVAGQRPALAPNRLLIHYIDRHFALDGKLNQLAVER